MVAAPDERLGEHAAAFLRLRDGAVGPDPRGRARPPGRRPGLAKPKWPESLYAVAGDLPRTPSGKVQKYRLRQSLRDGEPWK